MHENLENANPKFIEWAGKKGIDLENPDQYEPWLKCWVNGYVGGVDDVILILGKEQGRQ